MAQTVDVIGYGPVTFPDGMSKDDMAAALKQLPAKKEPTTVIPEQVPVAPTTTPTTPLPASASQSVTPAAVPTEPPAAPIPAPTEDLTKPAFIFRKQPAKALEARAVQVKAEESKEIPFTELYTDPKKLQTIQAYSQARFGKEGVPKEGESSEDYVKRWASHMRMTTQNFVSGGMELAYLNNTSKEDLLKAREVYDLFDRTAGYFSEKGGQAGVKPVLDALGAMIDIPTVLSLGVGKVATSVFMKTAAKEGLQAAIKSRLGTLAAVPATEGVLGAAANTVEQKRKLTVDAARLDQLKELSKQLTPEEKTQYQPEIDALQAQQDAGVSGKQAAIAGAISAVAGTVETAALVGAARKISKSGASTELEDILAPRRPTSATGAAPAPTVNVKPADPTQKALEDQYDIFEGRKLLNDQGDPTSVAEMQIRNDVNQKAAQVAKEVWSRVPELAPQANQKISDAVKNVFMNIDQIDDIVLQDSLSKAGITAEEFARMNRTTAGDAGRTLQAYSVLARIQNKLKSIDPAAAKEVDAMYGNRNAITSAFTGLRDFGMRLDRELKALMVSQVATTIRNGFSGLAVVTFGTASEAIESALYRMGKTASELTTGKPVTGSFTNGIKGVYDDAVRTTFYLGQPNLSSQTAEALLSGSPTLQNMILKTAGDAGDKALSAPARIANTLNVAQDAFFRKAIFTASVEKQLSRVGINMYDVMAQGKNVPFDVLKNATDEALTATFSKMPTKGPMFHAVKLVEELGPVGSTLIPFPRFMANAMSWTYKHSPMGIFSGATDVAVGAAKQMNKETADAGVGQMVQGLENISKGTVGTAAIYAAFKYRQENQDTNWYDVKNPDGSLVDTRALFPMAPFLAIGDYLVKYQKGRTDEFKAKELVEALIGFKAPAGTTAWLGDKFAEASSGMQTGEGMAEQKVATFFGEWVGEYFGRALVPVQQLSDIIGAIDRDETLPRDAYQIAPGEEGFASSAKQQLMKRTPVLKQELPVYQPAVKESATYNDSGILKMFSGIVIKGNPTPLENELIKLKIPSNKVFTSTGDKIVDASARKIMAPLLLQTYEAVSNTDWYKGSSPDMKKIALQNTLAFAQKNAKEIAVDTSQADAFAKGQQARIFEVKYSALPPEVKRATAEMYKQQTGQDLASTKAYVEALAYAAAIRDLPGFAAGGLISDIASRMVGTTIKRTSSELLQDMQETIAKRKLTQQATEVLPVAEQTTRALPAAPVARPAQQAMPVEAPKTVSKEPIPVEPTPTPSTELNLFDELKTTPDTLQTEFTPYQLQEAEKLLKTSMGSQYQLDKFKADYPADYLNSLNKKASEVTPMPTDVEQVTSFKPTPIEYDDAGNPIGPASTSLMEPKVKNSQVMAGDLNVKTPNSISERKKTLQLIREERMFNFDNIMSNKDIAALPDAEDVAAVVQGDFRVVRGREFDPKNVKDVTEFVSMSKEYQNRLNVLREKFKDEPPVKLFHGSDTTTSDVQGLKTKGFQNPQEHSRYHMELDVGGVSFTKDINLNYETGSFGGKDPNKFVYTEMPYADYIFKRINMAPDAYENKNLNIIAQSLNGSDNVVRPVSLPRTRTFKETEDIFTEADKLIPSSKASGKQVALYSGEQEVAQRFAGVSKRLTKEEEIKAQMFELGRELNSPKMFTDSALQKRVAYKAYESIRSLLNTAAERGLTTSTKTGIGQRYQNFLQNFADVITTGEGYEKKVLDTRLFISNTANLLEQAGAKQKAEMLNILNKNLDEIRYGSNESTIKSTDNIRKLTQKFNSGGLVSKR
jgi:hypothetical protein